ncbi:hypothetical protein ACIOBL_27510 [Paenibacillus taichungensis]|uniref:hypothetical protein n=1 Tax=Paenibacillus taichungensis TaxID=484184 RepID=UPI0037F19D27
MYDMNVDGYKLIFYLENLLREYIDSYITVDDLESSLRIKLEGTLIQNLITLPAEFSLMLKYTHLGELVEIIKTNKFNTLKGNDLKKVGIQTLIKQRNNVMHSRAINTDEYAEIQGVCKRVIESLKDEHFKLKWQKFLIKDINQFAVPQLYLEYPSGKNFDKLIGRSDELRELKEFLKAPTPISIIGHGGLGKTALVLQLIEDLMNSPEQPFDQIYFMSFKNSVFDKGEIRRFEKVISDHTELINRLGSFMDITKEEFKITEEKVWEEIFSKKTLLVLDNLETEIVRSNMSEFIGIAQKFIKKFDKASRLIITSRYGLGDGEIKFPLYQFDLSKTQELVKEYMNGKALRNRKISKEDWEWIQSYTQGNPGLIIALCHTFSSTSKSVIDLRVEYESEYTKESTELHNQLDEFLGFCFENTIESMHRDSQIFLSCLCYICSEAHISEVNEELLAFLKEELAHQKLNDINLRGATFVNIGFLQPIPNSDRYNANELVIDFMNGNYSNTDQVFNVFKLKESDWFKDIESIKVLINEIKFDEEISLNKLTSELYLYKYKANQKPEFLLKAFYCYPTMDSLLQFFKKSDETVIMNHFNLLDKIKAQLKDKREHNKQHLIVYEFVSALLKINQKILKREVANFRQRDLFDFFNQLEQKVDVLRVKNIDKGLRKQICKLLISLKKLDLAEDYLTEDETMIEDKFDIYVKQVMELGNIDEDRCIFYIKECTHIINNHPFRLKQNKRAQFNIYASRFLIKKNPNEVLKILENYEQFPINSGMSMYCFYLESLLLRTKAAILSNQPIEIAKVFLDRYKKQSKKVEYSKIFHSKQESLKRDFDIVERMLSSALKKSI